MVTRSARHITRRTLLENLESRVLLSGGPSYSAYPVAVAPCLPYEVHSKVMMPGKPETGASTSNNGKHIGQGGPGIPVLPPPPLPTPTVIKLANPSDLSPLTVPSNATLWGTWNGVQNYLPDWRDERQGGIGDCWVMGPLQILALKSPGRLASILTEGPDYYLLHIGDVYYQLDKTLNSWGAQLGPGVALWPLVFEKYEAALRGSYAALNGGWMSSTAFDLGLGAENYSNNQGMDALIQEFNYASSLGKVVTFGSDSVIADGADLVASHCYEIVDIVWDSTTQQYMLDVAQPWGPEQWMRRITYSNTQSDFYYQAVVI